MPTATPTHPAARPRWPLERVLFALAGTMTLFSVVLTVPQPVVPAAHRVRRRQPVALRHRRQLPRVAVFRRLGVAQPCSR